MDGFKPGEAVQRKCGLKSSNVATRPVVHSLTVLSQILQHMINYIFLLKEGHQDEVSYFEAFLVDCILTCRRVNNGYENFQHMKKCSRSMLSILIRCSLRR